MPNVKKISITSSRTGKTVYCIIRRDVDVFRLDDADGTFAANPADPHLSLAEDAVIKGLYEVSESRTAWDSGVYTIIIYEQVGGGPSPGSDIVIGSGETYIISDAFTNINQLNVDANNNVRSAQQFPTGAVVADGNNDTIQFKTNLTEAANDYYKDCWFQFTSGALIKEVKKCSSYDGTNKIIHVVSAYTGTPAPADTFKIINE